MAQKKKQARKNDAGRHQGPPKTRGKSVAVARLDALLPEFVAWEAQAGTDAAAATGAWELVSTFAGSYAESMPFADIDGFDAVEVAGILARSGNPELAAGISFVLDRYLHFLEDTDRWTRGTAALDEMHMAISADGPELSLPELAADEAWAAWERTTLIRRARNLFGWVGKGRDITASGALRVKDLQEAAALVDVHVRGVRHAKRLEIDPFDIPPTGTAAEPLVVGAMADVPRLPLYWDALQAAGFLEPGSTRIWRNDLAEPFLEGGGAEERVGMCEGLAVGFIFALAASAVGGANSDDGIFLLSILAAAATDEPPSAGLLDEEIPAEVAANLPDIFSTLMLQRVRPLLHEAVDAGLLEPGIDLVMPPMVVAAIARAMDELMVA